MSCDLTAYIQKSVENDENSPDNINSEVIIQIQIQVNQDTNEVSYIPFLSSQTTYSVPQLSEGEMEQANYEHRRQRAIENGQSFDFEAEFVSEMENFASQPSGPEQQMQSGNGGSQQDFFKDYEWMVNMGKGVKWYSGFWGL